MAVSATKKAGANEAVSTPVAVLPATEPDENEGAERHGGDEGDDGKVDAGTGVREVEQRPQAGAGERRPRQQRPVAQPRDRYGCDEHYGDETEQRPMVRRLRGTPAAGSE